MASWLMLCLSLLVVAMGARMLWAVPHSEAAHDSRFSRVGAIVLLVVSVSIICLVGQLY